MFSFNTTSAAAFKYSYKGLLRGYYRSGHFVLPYYGNSDRELYCEHVPGYPE